MSIHFGYDDRHEHHLPTKNYITVFDVNLLKAEKTGNPSLGNRVGRVKDGKYSLHQNEYRRGPMPGEDFIENTRKCFMIFKCPEMVNINISIFIVLHVVNSTKNSGKWGYIIGNDDGYYDKFIGYKTGTLNQLVYGGGFPVKEYNCTIQSSVNILDKHLISCHWLISGSCLCINGIKSADSDFTANPKSIGETYGSIFNNERFTGYGSTFSKPFKGRIYDIKIISGFLEQTDIDRINSNIMTDHDIV